MGRHYLEISYRGISKFQNPRVETQSIMKYYLCTNIIARILFSNILVRSFDRDQILCYDLLIKHVDLINYLLILAMNVTFNTTMLLLIFSIVDEKRLCPMLTFPSQRECFVKHVSNMIKITCTQ